MDSFELPDVRCNLDDTEEALYRPLHPFVTSASMSAHPDGEWRDLAAAARFTRLRRLELSVGASLQGSNGGAAVLSAALESLPQLLSLRLEDGSLQPSTDIVQPPFGALLDVAAVPPLSQLTSLELNRVHLQGASFSALSRLTALRQLHGERLARRV